VDDFFLLGDGVVDLLGFVADAADAAASPLCIVERTTVVVTHLDQHEVARLRGGEDLVPTALRLEGATAPAAERVILDLDLGLVEQGGERIAPTLLPLRAVLHCRVADDEQCRHARSRLIRRPSERGGEQARGDSEDYSHRFSPRNGMIERATKRGGRCILVGGEIA